MVNKALVIPVVIISIVLVCVTPVLAQGPDLINGLISYHNFDYDNAGTWEDIHGDYDFIPYSAMWSTPTESPGLLGNAAYFGGENTMLKIPEPTEYRSDQDFTVSIWLNYESGGCQFLKTGPSYDTGLAIEIRSNNNTVSSYIHTPFYTSFVVTNDDTWHHVVMRYAVSSSILSVTVDGVTEEQIMTPYTGLSGQLSLGNASFYMVGALDEFGFWNRTLSDEEVNMLYNSGAGMSYEQFDDPLPTPTPIPLTAPNIDFNATDLFNATNDVFNALASFAVMASGVALGLTLVNVLGARLR